MIDNAWTMRICMLYILLLWHLPLLIVDRAVNAMNPNKMPLQTPLACMKCRCRCCWCWCRRCAIVFCVFSGSELKLLCSYVYVNASHNLGTEREKKICDEVPLCLSMRHSQASATKSLFLRARCHGFLSLLLLQIWEPSIDWRDHHKRSLNIVIRFLKQKGRRTSTTPLEQFAYARARTFTFDCDSGLILCVLFSSLSVENNDRF